MSLLPLNVDPVIVVTALAEPWTRSAPPVSPDAVLLQKVLFVMVTLPLSTSIAPPPSVAVFP